jgi:hypothetical protein
LLPSARCWRIRWAHRDTSSLERSPHRAGMDAELSTHSRQRQTRRVEPNCLINLCPGYGLSAHGGADFTQEPEHAALTKPVHLRELSRPPRNQHMQIGTASPRGSSVAALASLSSAVLNWVFIRCSVRVTDAPRDPAVVVSHSTS